MGDSKNPDSKNEDDPKSVAQKNDNEITDDPDPNSNSDPNLVTKKSDNELQKTIPVNIFSKVKKCENCSNMILFQTEIQFEQHMEMCEKNVKCPFCDKKFIGNSYLQNHIKSAHKNLKKIECEKETVTPKITPKITP